MSSDLQSSKTRVLVTGASGFLGGFVVPELVSRGYDVVALARSDEAAGVVAGLGAEVLRGDLDDAHLPETFAEADAEQLVSLASLGFGHAPAIVAATEAGGMLRSVFVSTTGIFTKLEPASKSVRQAGEAVIFASALQWTVIRPTMIYGGPGDRNMARLLSKLAISSVFPLPGGGHRLQQPVLVDDLAMVIVNALESEQAIESAYNVAGPKALSFRAIVDTAAEALGRRVRLVPVPLGPVRAAVRLYERRAAKPRLKVGQLDRLEEDKAFDIDGAVRDLSYAPRSFATGIALTAERCQLGR